MYLFFIELCHYIGVENGINLLHVVYENQTLQRDYYNYEHIALCL